MAFFSICTSKPVDTRPSGIKGMNQDQFDEFVRIAHYSRIHSENKLKKSTNNDLSENNSNQNTDNKIMFIAISIIVGISICISSYLIHYYYN